MKAKKLAVICTILGVFLLGGGVSVLASALFNSLSTNNYFKASKVEASGCEGLLLSDNDEFRKISISNTFQVEDITTSYKLAGELKVINVTTNDLSLSIMYENPDGGHTTLSEDFNVKIRDLNLDKLVYEGPMNKLGSGDIIGTLSSMEEHIYQFEVKTNREFTDLDSQDQLNFNLQVQGQEM